VDPVALAHPISAVVTPERGPDVPRDRRFSFLAPEQQKHKFAFERGSQRLLDFNLLMIIAEI
jgi:hypothetical protein